MSLGHNLTCSLVTSGLNGRASWGWQHSHIIGYRSNPPTSSSFWVINKLPWLGELLEFCVHGALPVSPIIKCGKYLQMSVSFLLMIHCFTSICLQSLKIIIRIPNWCRPCMNRSHVSLKLVLPTTLTVAKRVSRTSFTLEGDGITEEKQYQEQSSLILLTTGLRFELAPFPLVLFNCCARLFWLFYTEKILCPKQLEQERVYFTLHFSETVCHKGSQGGD